MKMAKPTRDPAAENAAENTADRGDNTVTPGPTSVPAGMEKPKRTRGPRKPSANALTPDDLRSFETYLTDKIQTGRKDDAVTDEQLEAWQETRKRVRGLITPPADKGGAQ
jgi:hypothetical protein